MPITHDDKNLYLVYLMLETPLLDNMLRAVALYRAHCPGKLPSIVGSSKIGRLQYNFGDARKVYYEEAKRFTLMDAIYMSLYMPFDDGIPKVRTHTPIPQQRHPIPLIYSHPQRRYKL